jgi:hypothetical protein
MVRQLCNVEWVGGHGIQNGECWSVQTLKEVRTPTHERIPKSAEIGLISHLLCENVGGVRFTTDVRNCNGTFVNPFMCNFIL